MIIPLLGQCRSPECLAQIVMTLTEKGKYLPVNFDDKFKEAIHRQIAGPHGRPVIAYQHEVYTPHWSTCIDPEAFRRRQQKAPTKPGVPDATNESEPSPTQDGLF